MKFKMGSHKGDGNSNDSLHDSTATSNPSPSHPNRPNANSGLFDESRMTNLRTPVDHYGRNASQATKQRGKELDRRERNRAELTRALLMTIALPLAVSSGYLVLTGKKINLSGSTLPTQPLVAVEDPNNRSPATSATLPAVKVDSAPAVSEVDLSQILLQKAKKDPLPGQSTAKRPVQLHLDENGKLVSPFSVELDENGNEVARMEYVDHLVFLQPIPYGNFEKVSSFASTKPSDEFTHLLKEARPLFLSAFKYTPDEIRRFNFLRNTMPEITFLIEASSRSARELIGRRPAVVRSLDPAANSPELHKQALTELEWIEPVIAIGQITGDRTYDDRLKTAILEWARTYNPSGSIDEDVRMSKIAMAYEYLLEKLSPTENSAMRAFLMKLADVQLVKFKSHKIYDRAHAQHVYLMTALGGALRDPRILEHAVFQYRKHVDQTPMLLFEAFGYDNLVSIRFLLESTVLLERLGFRFYQNQVSPRSLANGIEILKKSSETEYRWDYTLASIVAGYFDPTVFETVSRLSNSPGNRFATPHGISLAATRKDYSLFKPVDRRIPSSVQKNQIRNVPNRLPPKRSR